mmetsp:Transcript_13140/g.31960  ORF Transcript_13140/g.31960 Transcript_13140/m.31960 type:complete len:525 (-) Transcript_13140:290-1864(-)
MRLLQSLKIVLLGSTLPAQGYTVAEGYERAARACSTAAQNVSCPTDSEDHVALASSSSITPTNSPAEPSVAATSALAAAALSEEIRGFEDSLKILRPQFEKLRKISGDKGGIIPEDPIFGTYHDAGVASHDIEMTLIRYLRVSRAGLKRKEQGDAKKIAQGALDRIKATLEYRREYDVLAMHAPGMARKLMLHDTNPGACMYLADSGVTDKQNQPVLVGRLGLMISEDAEQHEPIVPANHIRAVMFAFERMASSLRLDKGQRRGIYILDCGMDKKSAPDLYDSVDSRPRFWSKAGRLFVNGLTMSGWKDANAQKRTVPGVLPHLDHHSKIDPGLPVLREALRQLTEYYPDFMERVYFVRPPLSFRAFMKVFSLMVDRETAEKFVVVPAGYESMLLEKIDAEKLPKDFGGNGPSLGRDDFLEMALSRYESESNHNQTRKRRRSAEIKARDNDVAAGVLATKDDALMSGGKMVKGNRVKMYLSANQDEVPLGEFASQTELVVSQTIGDNGRRKLMWPINGFVEVES